VQLRISKEKSDKILQGASCNIYIAQEGNFNKFTNQVILKLSKNNDNDKVFAANRAKG
jgi:hypothetical protein